VRFIFFTAERGGKLVGRFRMRCLLLLVLLASAWVPGAAASVTAGSTVCALDFNLRTKNLECVVAAGDVRVDLHGGLAIAIPVAGGQAARFAYDAAGRLVSATVADETTAFQYDDAGHLIRGGDATYTYDGLGRVTSAGAWSFAYGELGLIRAVGPDGSTVQYTYEKHGAVTQVDADTEVVRIVYGDQLRVIAIDAGEVTRYEYDRDGEPVRRTTSGEAVVYSYDRRGNLLRSNSDTGQTVEYTYDGRSLLQVSSAGLDTRFSYESAGLLVRAAGPDGRATDFAYDADGRLIAVLPEVGDEVVVSFEPGDVNQPVAVGYLWGDSRGDSFTLSNRGKLKTCARCP
jgi:YD repeat-containing protein